MTVHETLHDIILNCPLYKKSTYNGAFFRTYLPDMKPLNYFCDGQCKSIQTFSVSDVDNGQMREYHDNLQQYVIAAGVRSSSRPVNVGDQIYHLTIRCLKCKLYTAHFFLGFKQTKKKDGNISKTTIQKVGQLPSLESTVDPAIEKWLNKKDLELYKKGLRSETNGFGIGAFSYFRRIVEDNVERILDDILEFTDNNELVEAINDAKAKKNATERLEIVKDHAPQSFMAEGQNVFTIIYSALSAGMHAKSDEDCLNAAGSIRVCLAFLVRKIATAAEEKSELQSAIISLTKQENS